jgi:two-component system chemotaxis response regulator CheB
VSGRRLRVLVVEDSAVQRQLLTDLVARDPDLELAGWAANGAEAVRAVQHLKPDVVVLDERMPIMGGLEAARHIMHEQPTPIVMVTSVHGATWRELAASALATGVLAVHDKRGLTADPAAATELVRAIKNLAAIRLVRRRRDPQAADELDPLAGLPVAMRLAPPEVIAIGASTGGPQVVRDIIVRLPASFALPVLVVQHTTAGYANTLVDWLRSHSPLPVHLAQPGTPLNGPGVHVAPTGRHLVVTHRRLALVDSPPASLHRPSATVLFRSVAREYGARAVGILLTGMGDDGARGLLDLKRGGAITVAQDQASSVVFGMPGEAVRLGAAEYVLPPERIAQLVAAVGRAA